MKKETKQPKIVEVGERLSPDQYRERFKETIFGHLDNYFSIMMSQDIIGEEEREVYELAVKAFINDLAHNGLPSIRRERYNRELAVSCSTLGLLEKYKEMINTKRKYYP